MKRINKMTLSEQRLYREILRERRFISKFRNSLNILYREGCTVKGWEKIKFKFYSLEIDNFHKFITVKKESLLWKEDRLKKE